MPGTTTPNYNLYLPLNRERGWGQLVRDNFTTLDGLLKTLHDTAAVLGHHHPIKDIDGLQALLDNLFFTGVGGSEGYVVRVSGENASGITTCENATYTTVAGGPAFLKAGGRYFSTGQIASGSGLEAVVAGSVYYLAADGSLTTAKPTAAGAPQVVVGVGLSGKRISVHLWPVGTNDLPAPTPVDPATPSWSYGTPSAS